MVLSEESLRVALGLALADAARRAREDFPDIYERVDAILASPDRAVQAAHSPTVLSASECLWCGDNFVPSKAGRPQACCSNGCRGDYQVWMRRRGRLSRGA